MSFHSYKVKSRVSNLSSLDKGDDTLLFSKIRPFSTAKGEDTLIVSEKERIIEKRSVSLPLASEDV